MKKKLVRVSQYIKIRSIKTVGLALFSSLILAPSLYAQISLDVQDQSIRHILKEIEKAGEYKFFYNSDLSNLDHKTSISVQDKNIDEVMSLLLANTEISYKKEANNMIVLTVKSSSSPQAPRKTRKITGTVVDPDGLPIIGANVIEQGTTNGTITDLDGRFTLELPSQAGLVISYIGYKNCYLKVGTKEDLSIVLKENSEALDEVVVVGYGIQKKGDLTGAVISIKNEKLNKYATGNVGNALQGQMAGVDITSKSGKPGAGVDVKIRGTSSLGNSTPLYLIDGIPSDINNISPNDIESIEVLKDGAAAAIYGSRAANGVVLITSKRARSGKATVSLNAYFGIDAIAKDIPVMNAEQHVRTMNQAYKNDGLDPFYTASPESYGKGTNWTDEFYSTAPIQNYNIGLSGGSEQAKVTASLDYFDQEGIAMNTGFQRLSGRINSEFKNGKFTFQENLSAFMSHSLNENKYAVRRTLEMLPTVPVYDENNLGGYGGTYGDMFDIMSPVAAQNLINNKTNQDFMQGNFLINYEPIEKLNIKLNTGGTINNGYSFVYTDKYDLGTLKNPLTSITEDRSRQISWLVEGTANYDWTIAKHNFKFLVGASVQKDSYRNTYASGKGMPDGIRVIDAATQDISASGTEWNHTLASQFFRANYNFSDRYLASVTIRRDGSSRFGKEHRWGVFPSASFAWRFSNEPFFPKNIIINDAKLRLSYGELGNQEIGNYTFSALINSSKHYPFGTAQALANGATQVDLASPQIKWETNVSKNVGLDLYLFDSSLSLSMDYFINNVKDLLVRVPIPMSNGSNENPYQNVGEIENKGFELTANWKKELGDFNLEIGGVFSTVSNKVLKLGNGTQTIWAGNPEPDGLAENTTLTQEGGEIASFYLIKTNGIFQSQAEVDNYTFTDKNGNVNKIQPDAVPGDIRFVDANQDGKIDAKDRVYCGSAMPDFSYGLNIGAAWKNFDISAFFQGVVGNKIFNGTAYTIEGLSNFTNMSTTLLDAWTEENHSNVPRVTRIDKNQNSRTSSDRFLENGSYFRMKSLQIGYTIPSEVLSKVFMTSARVYISANNLFTITQYKGYDPDFYSGDLSSEASALLNRGVDMGNYPLSRSFRIGFQVTF